MKRQSFFRFLVFLTQTTPLILIMLIALKNVLIYNGFYITTHGNEIVGAGMCGAGYIAYAYIFWQYAVFVASSATYEIGLANSTCISCKQLLLLLKQVQNMSAYLILQAWLVRLIFAPYFLFNDLFILNGEYEAAIISVP